MPHTLYLVQSASSCTQHILAKLKQICIPQDKIIFFGEALTALTRDDLNHFPQCYCLDFEQSLLDPDFISVVTLLDYTQFADLVLQFERCVSVK